MPRDDDLDDLGTADNADLEQRFRDLETQAEIDRMRRGEPPAAPRAPKAPSTPAGSAEAPAATGPDPLAAMKAALDDDRPIERFVLALCPHCAAKNRISLTRLRTGEPRCGGCKGSLAFTRAEGP